MKEPKNLRIILAPVGQLDRKDLENIEGSNFKNNAEILRCLFHKYSMTSNLEDFKPQVLTAAEFRKMCVFNKARNAFDGAMLNIRKRKQCYNLSEFMDEFNNQEFGDNTDEFWLGYVKLK